MLPRLTRFNMLDNMFDEPFFTKRENELMKTDIKDKDGNYILEIDIPGCEKKDIQIEFEDGYLTVTASMNSTVDESNEKINYIHREKFYGKCSRSFYTGENIKEDDIKASFKNGILTLTFPKEKAKEIENKKYIEIDD